MKAAKNFPTINFISFLIPENLNKKINLLEYLPIKHYQQEFEHDQRFTFFAHRKFTMVGLE